MARGEVSQTRRQLPGSNTIQASRPCAEGALAHGSEPLLHHSRPRRRPGHRSLSRLSFCALRAIRSTALLRPVFWLQPLRLPLLPLPVPHGGQLSGESDCQLSRTRTHNSNNSVDCLLLLLTYCASLARLSPHPLSKHFKHCEPPTLHAPNRSSCLMRIA